MAVFVFASSLRRERRWQTDTVKTRQGHRCLWCISIENTLPRQDIFPSDGVNLTLDSLRMAPCSTRPVITSPTPLILYTPETQVRMAASSVRFGGKQASLKQSLSVSTWMLAPSMVRSQPLYHGIFSVFLTRLSPSQPEMGTKGNSPM